MGLAYLHVLRTPPIPNIFEILRPFIKECSPRGAFTLDSGNAMLASGGADFIVFGKLFTSNPDLPARFQKACHWRTGSQQLLFTWTERLHRLPTVS
jgi:hypothetical protein